MADLNDDTPTESRRSFLRKLAAAAGGVAVSRLEKIAKAMPAPEEPAPEEPAPLEPVAPPYPPKYFGQTIPLNELVWRNDVVTLTNPPDTVTSGGKEAPILLTYDTEQRLRTVTTLELLRFRGQNTNAAEETVIAPPPRSNFIDGILPEQIQIDNKAGVLKVDGVVRVQWPVLDRAANGKPSKSEWLRDDVGPHVHIAPLDATQEPDLKHIIPATMPAIREHWMHASHIYKNAEQLEPHLTAPLVGRYHTLTPPPGQKERLLATTEFDSTRLDYRQWAYDNGKKTAYNMLHWQPDVDADGKQKFNPKRNNLYALNLALLESSWKDTPGCNPYITNHAGYMGLFQFGIQALGAHKGMVSKGAWQGIEINGDTIKNNTSFLHNWQAQMAGFQYHAYDSAVRLTKTWKKTHNKPHMRGIGLTGLMAAEHLCGPKAAVQFAETGRAKNDGTGTPNSFYAHKYGGLAEDTFYHGYDVNVTKAAQDMMDEMFMREQQARMPNFDKRVELPEEIKHGLQSKTDNLRRQESPNVNWENFLKEQEKKLKAQKTNTPKK